MGLEGNAIFFLFLRSYSIIENRIKEMTMKKRILAVAATMLVAGMVFFTACKKEKPIETKPEAGLYLGIVGFNDQLYNLPLSLLNQNTKFGFEKFVDNLTMENGTILYHAVNSAVDNLSTAVIPDDLINVSVVTFTDGLDQGSYILSNYSSGAEYLSAVNRRILNEKVGGMNIAAYSIGVRGSDVQDLTTFRNNLEKLSSDPTHNVFEVSSMSQAAEHFSDIARHLYNQSTFYNVSLKLPAQEPGDVIRFTFDNVSDASQSNCYIEGVYSRANNGQTGVLNDVKYVGLSSSSGAIVSGTAQGIFDLFMFRNLLMPNGGQVSTDHANLWKYVASTEQWQKNSEFTPSNNTEVVEEFRSALIVLVLDCSSSLNADFVNMKSAANSFIETLSGNYSGK